MKRWVVTGPTGAGKSLLTELLAERGASVIDADQVGHEILARADIARSVGETFGPEVLTCGAVDRTALGRLVFGDPRQLARLNGLVHPPLASELRARLDDLAADGTAALAVLEAAVYFLLPPLGPIDLTVAIVAPVTVRRERLMAGRGLSAAEADRRIAAQAYLEPFWARADVVIANEDDRDRLLEKAEELWQSYL
jgi:dephospho-CoA kinase